jgi:hypothetical protein
LIPDPVHRIAENNLAAHPVATHSITDLSGSATYGESQDSHGDSGGRWTGSDSRNSDHRQQQQNRRPHRAWEEMMEKMQ